MPRMTVLDNFETTATTVPGNYDDHIDVAATPGGEVSQGSVAVPVVLLDGDTDEVFTHTVCTGWSDSSGLLYINATGLSYPSSLIVRCAPSPGTNDVFQGAQSLGGTVDGSTYTAACGCTHYLNIDAAPATVSLESLVGATKRPFGAYIGGIENAGHRTTLILYDTNNNQPSITWSHDASSISWETAAPQFTSGKRWLVVEVVGDSDRLFGWFRQF